MARNLEKQGITADRCTLNRQIKADNKLLRELKAILQKLTKAAEYSVARIAETLETLRDKIVLVQYQLLRNGRLTRDYEQTVQEVTPVLKEISGVTRQLKEKAAERKAVQVAKSATSPVQLIKQHQLGAQITTLTEEIEELRDKKTMLLASLDCHDETAAKAVAQRLQGVEKNLAKLAQQRETLAAQKAESLAAFASTRAEIRPEDAPAVLEERIALRRGHDVGLAQRLRDAYGKEYDYHILNSATAQTDTKLLEKADDISWQAI